MSIVKSILRNIAQLPNIWLWMPLQDTISQARPGFSKIPEQPPLLGDYLRSQLYPFDYVKESDLYANLEDIARASARPCLLALEFEAKPGTPEAIIGSMVLTAPLPPPGYGAAGLVLNASKLEYVYYSVKDLPEQSQALFSQIERLISDMGAAIAPPGVDLWRNVTTAEQAREIDSAIATPAYQEQWRELVRMIQSLASAYVEFHSALQANPEKRKQLYPLPSLTSMHNTRIPSMIHTRGLVQSFGPRVAQSLWNTEENKEQHLQAPNGARLAVRGENEQEQKALYKFIEGGMGVEGIKYMVTVLAAYNEQTSGVERKLDARVTLRQLLQFMGRDRHADDLDEQKKLMHYILYLARTWVTAPDKVQEVKRRGRPKEKDVEYTPLLVLEALRSDERGGLKIPSAIEFHLGKEFWDQMFGSHKHFFTLPTALILNYHSKDQPHEICLALYLANMLNLNCGQFAVHFPTLLIQTGLQDQLDIDQNGNRTRNALRVLFALEQLEKDHLIARAAHVDVDTALAIAYYAGETKYKSGDRLSEATRDRIENAYKHLAIFTPAEMRTRGRLALQNLLERIQHNAITFKSGALINTQIEQRRAGRQKAIENRERAQEAAARSNRKPRKGS